MMRSAAILLLLVSPGAFAQDAPPLSGAIDRAVSVERAGPVLDDAAFLKRLMGDLVGAPPGDPDLKAFAAGNDPKKRLKKIDEILASQGFADFWAKRLAEVFLGDIDKVEFNVEPPVSREARKAIAKRFVAWLAQKLGKDRPYTEIVSEMLDARGDTEGNPAIAWKLSFYRGEARNAGAAEFAIGAARQLMGIRLRCARCHDHPFDKWTVEQFYGMAAFEFRGRARGYRSQGGAGGLVDQIQLKYSDEGEMMIPMEEKGGKRSIAVNLAHGGSARPIFLFGGEAGKDDDRMKVLAQLMTSNRTTQLPRAIANRVWAMLLGRGVVHPLDDFNFRNRPYSGALLDALARGFAGSGYSFKSLVRAICASDIYQRADPAEIREGFELFWHGAGRAAIPEARVPKGTIIFQTPSFWRIDVPSRGDIVRFLASDKAKKARDAEFAVFSGDAKGRVEIWRSQMGLKNAPPPQAIEGGKAKLALYDLSGAYACDPRAEGPSKDRMLVGAVEGATKTWLFRLVGPVETVDGWRDEFLKLLKDAHE